MQADEIVERIGGARCLAVVLRLDLQLDLADAVGPDDGARDAGADVSIRVSSRATRVGLLDAFLLVADFDLRLAATRCRQTGSAPVPACRRARDE